MTFYFVFIPVLGLIAWLYASVGLGGGTAYISVLAFWNADPTFLRPTAWSLNIIASLTGFLNYLRAGHFELRLAWPFLLGGSLGAALGGWIQLDKRTFQALLAATLIWASIRMLRGKSKGDGDDDDDDDGKHLPMVAALGVGAGIGLLSGLVGIGGGIILGPVLALLGWRDMKRLAPITSLYILVNSGAALTAYFASGAPIDLPTIGSLSGVVLVAAFLGSWWGARKASQTVLRRIFGTVALVAGIKLLLEFTGLW